MAQMVEHGHVLQGPSISANIPHIAPRLIELSKPESPSPVFFLLRLWQEMGDLSSQILPNTALESPW